MALRRFVLLAVVSRMIIHLHQMMAILCLSSAYKYKQSLKHLECIDGLPSGIQFHHFPPAFILQLGQRSQE